MQTDQSSTLEYSESVPGAPLEDVLCLRELDQRPTREPNFELQNQAVSWLLTGFTTSPQTVLQSLTDTILKVLNCDSAGISLINEDRTRFHWPAVSGILKPHIGGGTPLNFGPCGDVLNAGHSLLMKSIHLRYTYFTPVPWVKEVLLVPFDVNDEMVGTIWAVIHEPPNNHRSTLRQPELFDREDLRLLEVLGHLSTQAYQIWRTPSCGSASSRWGR